MFSPTSARRKAMSGHGLVLSNEHPRVPLLASLDPEADE